ncbi:MAG: hypothetical protein GX275_10265 [Clostridiales bacterium]|nr:hypothetical protein [Clostridiales bacterium]
MRTKKYKIVLFPILSLFLAINLVSCSLGTSIETEKITENINYEVQTITHDNFTYEIPADWDGITFDGAANGQVVYAPKDADINNGTSSVNIIITNTNSKASKLKDFNTSKSQSQLETQLNEKFSNGASNFEYKNYSTDSYDVFSISYDISYEDVSLHLTQYNILVDNYTVLVTATNNKDGINPSPEDVAKRIVNSFKTK